ncbi:protein scabrous-like [Uloborus diversus]|uniref:protein scabrous-like n=1 Tax=Uloborus diversus TaxID=327109 RepID=UPI00240A741E|nr:protein scabrous-like [Uloborus diversus]
MTRLLRTDVARVEEKLREAEERHQETRQQLDKFVRSLPKDCSMMSAPGPALIQVPSLGPTEVHCDPPWLIFQRRSDGSEDFFRDWADYRRGFGSPRKSEFWLGNELLHRLTKKGARLRVELWDVQDRYFVSEYDTFHVGPEEDRYALQVGGHRGNVSDALRHHTQMGFSTKDKDNDASSTHCALHYTSGWWYQHCHRADLNGRFPLGVTWYDETNHDWLQLKKVEMKLATAPNTV